MLLSLFLTKQIINEDNNSLLFTSSAVIQKNSGEEALSKEFFFVCLLEHKNPDGNLKQEQDFRMVSPGTGV